MSVRAFSVAPRTIVWHFVAPTWLAVVVAVLLASLLVAASARVAVPLPFSPVPITGQTFAVLLIGAALGARLGAAAIVAYLVEGLAGLPVFAAGTSAWSPSAIPGVPVIAGPTAGYLFGFAVGAFVVGWLAERGWDRGVTGMIFAMVLGNLAIYAVGLAWLARFVGSERVFALGMQPFLAGDLAKVALAAVALPGTWRLAAFLRAARTRREGST
jgi:biotin transport system substrate-specific component